MQFEKLLQQSLVWRGFYFATVLLLNVLLSRCLQAEGSGSIYFLTSVFAFILLAGSINIENGISYYAAEGSLGEQSLACFALLAALLSAMVVLPLTAAYFFLFPQAGAAIAHPVLYGVLYCCGILLTSFFSVQFYARKNFLLPNVLLGVSNICLAVLIGVLQLMQASGSLLVPVFFTAFLVQGILMAGCYFYTRRLRLSATLPGAAGIRRLVRYSLVSLAGNILFLLFYKIDYWFVQHWCTAADMGNYIQASRLGQMLLIVPQILAGAIFPQTAAGLDRLFVKRNIIVIARLLMQFFLLLILLTALLGKWAFVQVFGPSFGTMYLPFLLLLPGILSLSILAPVAAYLGGINQVRINVMAGLYALVFVTAANFYFTPRYGIMAAAVISTIGYTICLLYSFRFFFKEDASLKKELFQWRKTDYAWLRKMLLHKN